MRKLVVFIILILTSAILWQFLKSDPQGIFGLPPRFTSFDHVPFTFPGLSIESIDTDKLRRYFESSADWKVVRPDQPLLNPVGSGKLSAERRAWDNPVFEATISRPGISRVTQPDIALVVGLDSLAPDEKFDRPTVEGFEKQSLNLEIGVDDAVPPRYPNSVPAFPHQVWYESTLFVRGSKYWVYVRERATTKDRVMTRAALENLENELQSLEKSEPRNGFPFDPQLLSSNSILHNSDPHANVLSSGKDPSIFDGTGYVNMGEPGILCWNVVQVERAEAVGNYALSPEDLEECRTSPFYSEVPGWSKDPTEKFFVSFTVPWKGPGDGEQFPFNYQEILWFIPDGANQPRALLITPDEQGHAKKTIYLH